MEIRGRLGEVTTRSTWGGGAAVMTEQEEGSDGEKLQAVSQQGNAMHIYIFVNTFSSSILLLMSTKLVP